MVCGWRGIPLTSPSWIIRDLVCKDVNASMQQCAFSASLGLLTRRVQLRGPL
jgi:hypothetical protein